MLITTYQKLHKLLVKNTNITVNNQALDSVTSEKLLGVVGDQNLTWKGHVLNIAKPFFSFPTFIIVVQSGDLPNYKDCTSCRKEQLE